MRPSLRAKIALLLISCSLVVAVGAGPRPAAGQRAPDDALASNGITQIDGQYMLADERNVYQMCMEAMEAYKAASKAVQDLQKIAAANQAITYFQQRIAIDRAIVDDMRLAAQDGVTLAEQIQRRTAKHSINVAKQARGQMGLAKAKAQPKVQKKMESQAMDACKAAEAGMTALRAKVREVADRYRSLADDPAVLDAVGRSTFGPSDFFSKLAARLNIPAPKPRRGNPDRPPSPGAMSKRLTNAAEELKEAVKQLEGMRFRSRNRKEAAERDAKRDRTIGAINSAIAKLEKGEVDSGMLDEAIRLNSGYPDGLLESNKQKIDAAAERLKKAAELVREAKGK